MALTIKCDCGVSVPFEEIDRGYDVYCPSCGKAWLVPKIDQDQATENPATKTNRRDDKQQASGAGTESIRTSTLSKPASADRSESEFRPSIFSLNGAITLGDRPGGTVTCLCGTPISYTVNDIGGSVYCPSCTAEVRIGNELGRGHAMTARTAAEIDSVSLPSPRARLQLVRSPLGAAALIAVLASVALGGILTWNHRTDVFELVGLRKQEVRQAMPDDPSEFDPALLTDEVIAGLLEEETWPALVKAQTWTLGLRQHGIPSSSAHYAKLDETAHTILVENEKSMTMRATALEGEEDAVGALETAQVWAGVLSFFEVPDSDPRQRELLRVIKLLVPRADPITLERIEKLLQQADPFQALVDAQLMQETLHDREVPDTDARVVRLVEVIGELELRLVPKPKPPPPWLRPFREAVQRLADQLQHRNLDAAIRARKEADELLHDHPDDLAPYTRRFQSLKARLRQWQLALRGTKQIEQWLDQGESALASGEADRLSEVVEAKAWAKFLAPLTPMTRENAERFDQRVRKLSGRLKFEIGKRAVDDAERFDKTRDTPARDRAIRRAIAILPEFPGNEVRPLMERISAWTKEAGKTSTNREPTTDLGRQLARRDEIEAAMEAFGDGHRERLLDVCLEAENLRGKITNEHLAKLEKILFDALEAELDQLLLSCENLGHNEILARLAAIRQLLARATPWQGAVRWQALDGGTRDLARSVGEQVIQRARRLADTNKLQEALTCVLSAAKLNHPDVSQRAKGYVEQWQAELKRRADAAIEATSWQSIEALVAAKDQPLRTWAELNSFLERYPDSQHRGQALAYGETLKVAAEAQFTERVEYIEKLIHEEHWLKAFRYGRLIESLAVTDEHRVAISQLRQSLDDCHQRIATEYAALGTRKRMFTEDDILHVRRVATLYLAANPGDAEAEELLNEVDRKGALRAKQLVSQAKRLREARPDLFKAKLVRAYHLDPDGEYGRQAREMWAARSSVNRAGS